MSRTTSRLRLLGLAEELTDADPPLGDQGVQEALRLILDRAADALVDVARGERTLTRAASATPVVPGRSAGISGTPGSDRSTVDLTGFEVSDTSGPEPADRASCSALAARCQVASTLVLAPPRLSDPSRHSSAVSAPPSALAVGVADCLRELASGLQRYVQDLADTGTASTRQRLHRSLRRAAAHLEAGAP